MLSSKSNNEMDESECQLEWLYFPTREDYEETIEYLSQCDDSELNAFENQYVGYESMRMSYTEKDLEGMGIYDDILATLLNKTV